MITTLTLDELSDYLQPLVFFGTTLFEINKHLDGGMEIVILDEERGYFINNEGDIIENEHHSMMKMATLFLNQKGLIEFIEHPYKTLTKANKTQVELLIRLIGSKIKVTT